MKLDTANRSFFLLLVVALAPYLVLGLFGRGVLSVAMFRVATSGSTGWDAGAWPAVGFLAVSAVGSVLGLRSLWRQRQATVELGRFVRRHQVPDGQSVARVAAAAHVERLDVVDHGDAFSFTYGVRRPRVVLSRGLLVGLDDGELRAVLVHERYHVRNLDPLKVVVARALPSAFFFLPALRHLRFRYLAGRELAADRRAVRACGRRCLAGALYKVVAGPSPATLGAAAAVGGVDLLDVRLAQLEDGREPPLPRISALALAATTVGVVLMAVGFAATVNLLDPSAGGWASMGSGGPLGLVGGGLCAGMWLVGALAVYAQLDDQRHTS